MLHNYVISLRTADTRRRHIMTEFSQKGIPFKFFDAITPSDDKFECAIASLIPNMAYQHQLTLGEKTCFISHILLWQKCVEENLPYISIFEDDVLLGKNATMFLTTTDWLNDRFKEDSLFVIKTETFLDKCKYQLTDISPVGQHQFTHLLSTHYGAAGYIISQATARYLLDKLQQAPIEEINPSDHLLFRYYERIPEVSVYQLYPAICIQADRFNKNITGFSSQLEEERYDMRIRNKQHRSLFSKLVREIKKIPTAIRKLSFKIVPFE